MLSRKALTVASLSTLVCSTPGAVAQEAFDGAKFLEYSRTTRDNYISTAAGMAGVIATQNRPDQAKCIDRWVAENSANGFEPALDVMRKQPKFHPLGVLLAVLQKSCGSFKY